MGRVSRQVTEARRQRLRELLGSRQYLPLSEVCSQLGVSEATARRDLASLENQRLIRRTHGGALGPYSGALGDFEAFFPTFDQRRQDNPAAKASIAEAACSLLTPGGVIFLDSGSTCFAVAEHIETLGERFGPNLAGAALRSVSSREIDDPPHASRDDITVKARSRSPDQTSRAPREDDPPGLTVLTHNLAVAVKLAPVRGVRVEVLGGALLPRQAALFGDETCRAVSGRRIDIAIMGCEAMDAKGVWNSQKDVVRLQRAAMAAAERRIFLIDAAKTGERGPVHLAPWTGVDLLVTDAPNDRLLAAGIELPATRRLHVGPGIVRPRFAAAGPPSESVRKTTQDRNQKRRNR